MDRNSAKLNVARLTTLVDGIFAIAMTILVISIDLPKKGQELTSEGLHNFLLGQFQEIFSYALSFLLLAIFWMMHHQQFHYIQHTNRRHLWINIMILMSVTLVPFSTSLAGDFPNDWMTQGYFNLNMLIMGILFYLNWAYATKNKRLVDASLDDKEIIIERRKLLIIPTVALLALPLSIIAPRASTYLYLLIPVILSLKIFNLKEN